jgi:hypothetical protein
MQIKSTALLTLALAVSTASAQTARRWAIVEANAPATRSNPLNVLMETRVTSRMNADLTGRPGLTLVSREQVESTAVKNEAIFQNGDRASTDTAVQMGKLLGASQIVFVSVYDAVWSTHADVSGSTTVTTGTVVLRATARIVDVQTGVLVAQPSSEFQDSAQLSKTSTSQGFQYGMIRVPAAKKSTGGDPNVIQDNELAKAVDTVASELAGKLAGPSSNAPSARAATAAPAAPALPMNSPLVAGIANGNVYINQGSNSGVKPGDQLQIVRDVSLGFPDPTTGQPMTEKQNICVLTIVKTTESNASGTCNGGSPQGKDIAMPLRH